MGTYQCQNMGCPNGFESTFEMSDEEEQYYADHGLSSPKSCPDCRSWKKRQVLKYPVTCEACGNQRVITPQRRITFHKKIGPWQDPTLCKLCEKDPERARNLLDRKIAKQRYSELRNTHPTIHRKRYGVKLRIGGDGRLKNLVTKTTKFHVLVSPDKYSEIKYTRAKDIQKHGTDALTHIMKEGHNWEQYAGSNDPHVVLLMAQEIAEATGSHIIQCHDRDTGFDIKVDTQTGFMAIFRQYESPPPPYRFETAYVLKTPDAYAADRIYKGKWLPNV